MRILESSRWLLLAGGLPCVLLSAACGGPSVSEIAGQELTLQVSGVNLGPTSVPSGDDERGDFTMSRALISVGKMTLTACATGAEPITIDPRVYDLLAEPPLGERVTTAVYEWCTLRVDLAPSPDLREKNQSQSDSQLFEIQDETHAKYAYGSSDSPSLTFTAIDAGSFGEQPLLLGFDLSAWLDYIAGAATNPEPGSFDDSLTDVVALYVDSNGNGALDDDEQTPVALTSASR